MSKKVTLELREQELYEILSLIQFNLGLTLNISQNLKDKLEDATKTLGNTEGKEVK
jgi:hypothetical protein